MSEHDPHGRPHAPLRICENCRTALQGGYCHLCGQSEHSPVRHLGHAVEEVFESFWHLDGRIFRTLRDLFVPGRIANGYLSGHRVRYVAPMRLFVILSLLTAFVAKIVVTGYFGPIDATRDSDRQAAAEFGIDEDRFGDAATVAEVERVRERLLDRIDRERARIGDVPGAGVGITAAERAINAQAAVRIAQLEAAGDNGSGTSTDAETPPPQELPETNDAEGAAGADAGDATSARGNGDDAATAAPAPSDGSSTQPEAVGPPDDDRATWFEAKAERIGRNFGRLKHEPAAVARALIGAAPMTLFVMVPLFAMLLKVLYLFKRRSYLEHVVIGLYSHAYLMLALLLVFACSLLTGWLVPQAPWLSAPLGWAQALLLISMPLYLLWMQKRVYRQSWLVTLFKYCVLGMIYSSLFVTVAVFTGLYAMAEM